MLEVFCDIIRVDLFLFNCVIVSVIFGIYTINEKGFSNDLNHDEIVYWSTLNC